MSKLTDSARGQECTLRIAPYCNRDPATVVACHLPFGDRGTGFKAPDWWTVHGCSACHAIIDGRDTSHEINPGQIYRAMLRAHFLTTQRYIDQGLITIKGAK